MDRLFGVIGDFQDPRLESGDSAVDKLNSRYSVFLLFVFSAVVTLKQHYMVQPIQCWHPDHFHSSWEDYADSICWVNNTYYVSWDEDYLPKENEEKKYIGYYQWTSIILAYQALLFYIPRIVWMTFNKKSGVEVTTITGAAIDCQMKSDTEEREKTLKYMAKHMGRFLGGIRGKRSLTDKLRSAGYSIYGLYLFSLYIFVKALYVFNCVGQLLALDHLLGLRQHMYGINFIKILFSGSGDGMISPLFPRVAMCDFKVRSLGNIHRYTVQCALPINLFNEKIFIFVWFWLVFVSVATCLSLLIWLWRAVYMDGHMKFIKSKLITMEKIKNIGKEHDKKIKAFVTDYLRRDGLLIVYLVGINASDLIASELICKLWDHYLETQGHIKWDVGPTDPDQAKKSKRNAPLPPIASAPDEDVVPSDEKIPLHSFESIA